MAIAILALPIFALSAFGQCRTVRQQSFVQQQYATPYYSNYQIVQPVAVQTFLIPNTYYSVEPDLAAARIQQQIADDAAERALAKMLNLLKQQQPQQPGGLAQPQANVPGEHPSSLTTKVQATVNAQCVKCHQPGGSRSETDLRDITKVTGETASMMFLLCGLEEGNKGFMPKGGHFVGQQAFDDIGHWAYEVTSKTKKFQAIPPSVPNVKETPKPPLPPKPMDKAKDKGGDPDEVSFLDPNGQLDAKKKRPKPRPRPIG
jgi:mono/diheme cytochrome c family protein